MQGGEKIMVAHNHEYLDMKQKWNKNEIKIQISCLHDILQDHILYLAKKNYEVIKK